MARPGRGRRLLERRAPHRTFSTDRSQTPGTALTRRHTWQMLLVTSSHMGEVTFERLLRDRIVSPMTRGVALPRDVASRPGIRAHVLGTAVPQHTVVSALGGLWVHAGGIAPTALDVVGARGLHRTVASTSTAGLAITFHSGLAATEPAHAWAGLRVASLARCGIDALRWADLALAFPAITAAVRQRHVSVADLDHAYSADDPRGQGYRRLESAWKALRPALIHRPGSS